MNRYFKTLVFVCILANFGYSQTWDPIKKCLIDANGNCLPSSVLTAMPFLRIAPDARGGAMGETGVAIDPDANTMYYNPSALVFTDKEMEFTATFTPWLRSLGLSDVYLAYLGGYRKLDENQAVGLSMRYFSMGQIQFTDAGGTETGIGNPREMEIGTTYSRKLGDNFSAGISGKFYYSNLASGQVVNQVLINSATSFGADISLSYRKKATFGSYKGLWAVGANLSNIAAKVSYTDNSVKDPLPTNLAIGGYTRLDFDEHNSLGFALDFNKLLVPSSCLVDTLPCYDKNQNQVPDFREKGLFDGMLGSFGDAPGGFKEEMQEIAFSLGAEYWYDKQFAVRAGYYNEHSLKGGRKFWTIGAGVKYNVFELNLSFLIPGTNQPSPLDNTLRFGLNFNWGEFKDSQE